MSIGFNWFKDYEIKTVKENICNGRYDYAVLKYMGGGDTSHSAGNIIRVQELLEEYGNIRIPEICEDWLKEGDKLDLVDPKEISKVCKLILDDTKVDEVGMRERIKWFKELSDEGYYLTYDCD